MTLPNRAGYAVGERGFSRQEMLAHPLWRLLSAELASWQPASARGTAADPVLDGRNPKLDKHMTDQLARIRLGKEEVEQHFEQREDFARHFKQEVLREEQWSDVKPGGTTADQRRTFIKRKCAQSLSGPSRSDLKERKKGQISEHATELLTSWVLDHLDNPYPTQQQKAQFSQSTGLTATQVGV